MEYLRFCAIQIPFFSLQVWLRAHPQWQGQPLALLGPGSQGGVVQCTPWAKRLRIPSLTPGAEVRKKWPTVRLVESNHTRDLEAIESLLHLLRQQTPHVQQEQPGLFLLDLAGTRRLHGADQQAWLQGLLQKLSSMGYEWVRAAVAPVRAAALALAQVHHAPRSMLFSSCHLKQALGQVAFTQIHWLDPKIVKLMRGAGLRFLRDLWSLDRRQVLAHWGATGEYLYALAQGVDATAPDRHPKPPRESVSVERRFEPAITLRPMLRHACHELGNELQQRLHQNHQTCKKIDFQAFFSDGRSFSTRLKATPHWPESLQELVAQIDWSGGSIGHLICRALQPQCQVQHDFFTPINA